MNLEKWYLELGAKEVYFHNDDNNKCSILFTDAEWVKGLRAVTIDFKGNIWSAQAVTFEEIQKASDFVKSYYTIN